MSIKKLLPGVKTNTSLKNYTTFKIGGRAEYFFVAKTKEDLIGAIKVAKKLKLPFFVLGGGSNLLISDRGFKGIVIKFGQPLSLYVSKGLEWAVGIPGTIQGAVWSNAGAFKKSMKDVVKEVEVFDTKTGKVKIFKNKDCRFSYRNSIFRKGKNLIILSVKIKSKKVDELRSSPRSANARVSNAKKIKQYLDYRKKTQPLEFPSAGSVFKNPVGFSAGELIAKVGFKGKKIGQAQISEKHANFIVNLGGATAKDVKKLINLTKKSVKKKFKINLEEEIQFL
ncbi:MAG: UDP-N-acetylmuramate dehydrogenase [Candidatus Pacebacteria bacterium]|nr:UDP-N-acetylmuramate dehydrogenase [Candidatus Paceibacterota bacterium]